MLEISNLSLASERPGVLETGAGRHDARHFSEKYVVMLSLIGSFSNVSLVFYRPITQSNAHWRTRSAFSR
jgi:hypothetical protein